MVPPPVKWEGEDQTAFFAMAPPPPLKGPREAIAQLPASSQGVAAFANAAAQSAPSGQSTKPAFDDDFNWSMYDYHPQDDGGFWQLRPIFAPSEQLPATIPLAATNQSPIQQSRDAEYTCLGPACPAKPFKRKMDLERHYKNAHPGGVPLSPSLMMEPFTFDDMAALVAAGGAGGPAGGAPTASAAAAAAGAAAVAGANSMPSSAPGPAAASKASPTTASPPPAGNTKDGGIVTGKDVATTNKGGGGKNATKTSKDGEKESLFLCDYAPCPRRNDGFPRKDRFRQHLQESHKEDVVKKGGKLEDSWLDGRKMSSKWWRCSRCLERVKIDEHGWECPKDQVKCEAKRRQYREKMAQQ